MKKRLFAILIAALLITGMLPLSVFAATEKHGSRYIYDSQAGTFFANGAAACKTQ